MKRKLLAVILSMCMVLSLTPGSVFALAEPAEQSQLVAAAPAVTEAKSADELTAAVEKGGEVRLAADVVANVVVPEGVTVVLNLNGHTLNGGTDKVDGAFTEHKDKPAILNNGTVTIKDSVGSGTIKRDDKDNGKDSYYVIDNQGILTIESGSIVNESGFSSLIRNGGFSEGKAPGYAKLYIKGGVLEQNNFIAIKNDEQGLVEMTGGTVSSKNESAVQNWATAKLSGGTINGLIWTLAYDAAGSSSTTLSGSVEVNGKIWSKNYAEDGKEKADTTITGGTYNLQVAEGKPGPELQTQPGGSIVISGGSFNISVDPKYLAEGSAQNEAGVIGPLKDLAVAQIGDVKYTTLKEAMDKAKDGETIQLLKDVTLDSTMSVEKKLTIDGQAHAITGHIVNKSELGLVNVKITSSDRKAPTISNEDGTLNIDAASIVENAGDHYAIKTKGGAVVSSGIIRATFGNSNHGISANGTNITINGGLVKGSDTGVSAGIALFNRNYANDNKGNAPSVCVMNGGKIQGCAYAVAGNNQKSGGDPGCSLTVNKGELIADSAIYWPNNGSVVIGTVGGNDADVKITGVNGTGIETICGNLTINSGTISGTASQTVTDDTLLANYATSSGCGGCGDALTIVKDRAAAYAANPLSVTINGGTFLSANGNYSMRMLDCAGQEASGQTVSISVTGGMFSNGIECSRSNETGFISGGTFSSDPTPYLVDGYIIHQEGGKFGIVKDTSVAKIGDVRYATLAEAVKAVKDGETIVLNADSSEKITVSRTVKFTLDQNGHKFTGSIDAGSKYAVSVAKGVYNFTFVGGDSSNGGSSKPTNPTECSGGASCPSKHLLDVDKKSWYHTSVDYVVKHKLMSGTTAFTFEPELTTSRGMIVTMLYNLEKRPTVTAVTSFKDVANDSWYANAVRWAVSNHIVAGYDNNTFGPEDPVTREQMAVILYHYAAYKGCNISSTVSLSHFVDMDQISDWALTAMQWANANGLINGTNTATILPQVSADRAQTACMLRNFCEELVK